MKERGVFDPFLAWCSLVLVVLGCVAIVASVTK